MAIENTVSSDFDPRSSIDKSVFDSRISGVMYGPVMMRVWLNNVLRIILEIIKYSELYRQLTVIILFITAFKVNN